MKDWTTFNVKYFAIPFAMLLLGLTIVMMIMISRTTMESIVHNNMEIKQNERNENDSSLLVN